MPLKSFDLYEEEVEKNSSPAPSQAPVGGGGVKTLFDKYKKGKMGDDNSISGTTRKTNQKMFK